MSCKTKENYLKSVDRNSWKSVELTSKKNFDWVGRAAGNNHVTSREGQKLSVQWVFHSLVQQPARVAGTHSEAAFPSFPALPPLGIASDWVTAGGVREPNYGTLVQFPSKLVLHVHL